MIALLFTCSDHRDILAHILMMVRPLVFSAVARINRYCARIVKTLRDDKQQQWLFPCSGGFAFKHNGNLHGEHRLYASRNALHSIRHYDNGVPHGSFISWYAYSCVKVRAPPHFVSPDPRVKIYWRDTGFRMLRIQFGQMFCDIPYRLDGDDVLWRGSYEHGRKHGLQMIWNDNGTMRAYSYLDRGEYVGPAILWSELGRILRVCFFVGSKCVVHKRELCEQIHEYAAC